MKTDQEYKNAALEVLKGNWNEAVISSIIYVIIGLLCIGKQPIADIFKFNPGLLWSMRGTSTILSLFVLVPLAIGLSNAFRCLFMSGNPNIFSNLIGFGIRNYLHNIWVYFITIVKIFLWTLCLIIPGIIKSFSYAMVPYIMVEHPEYSAEMCTAESSRIMAGHRLELFMLYLSFIGWIILSIVTCGIGFFWLIPYMETTQAAFYNDIKDNTASSTIIL